VALSVPNLTHPVNVPMIRTEQSYHVSAPRLDWWAGPILIADMGPFVVPEAAHTGGRRVPQHQGHP
jgi:hypothetical protein